VLGMLAIRDQETHVPKADRIVNTALENAVMIMPVGGIK